MNELLRTLYDNFYEELPTPRLKAEVECCHQELIEKLDKPERKLVLQIIDCKDQIAEDLSIDSFISGFSMAWRLANELYHHEKTASCSREKIIFSLGTTGVSGKE